MAVRYFRTYTGKRVHALSPSPDEIDIDDVAHSLSQMCRFVGHTDCFYCVTPETRVLKADLSWVQAETLHVGDSLFGFDEWPVGEHKTRKNRHSRPTIVTHAIPVKRHCFRLHLATGETLTSSAEHPWLIATKCSGNQSWVKTKRIAADVYDGRKRHLHRFFVPWDAATCHTAGYLAGIFDGEGHVCHSIRTFTMGMAQNPGVVLETTQVALRQFGFPFTVRQNPASHVMNLAMLGSWQEKVGFLGIIRPQRLLSRFCNMFSAGRFSPSLYAGELVLIDGAEYIGERWVMGLETSTHTYFAEGFGAHNSVAQHSVLVSELVPHHDALWGLLHDASEAYLCDLPAPIKRDPEMSFYRIAEDRLMRAICRKFGLGPQMPFSVMAADKLALATEFRDVTTVNDPDWIVAECGVAPISDYTIIPWLPAMAEDRFLRRFWELSR